MERERILKKYKSKMLWDCQANGGGNRETEERYCLYEEIRESFIEDVTSELAWKNGWGFGYMTIEEEGILGKDQYEQRQQVRKA